MGIIVAPSEGKAVAPLVPSATSPSSSSSSFDSPVETSSTRPTSSECQDGALVLRKSSSVTFAPLPPTERKKRKHSLGVAGRARALQRRVASQKSAEGDSPAAAAGLGSGDSSPGSTSSPHTSGPYTRVRVMEDDFEDPFQTFGKFVKEASRRILGRPLFNANNEFVDSMGRSTKKNKKVVRVHVHATDGAEDTSGGQEPQGGVWEEEVSEDFRKRQVRRSFSDSDVSTVKGSRRRSISLVAPSKQSDSLQQEKN